MVLTVSFVLSPVTGLVCHRHRRLPADLTPASGCQDHTTSPSAPAPFVKGASASTASRPAAVTIACRPSVGQDGGVVKVICPTPEAKYFCKGGWTANSLICPSGTSGSGKASSLILHPRVAGLLPQKV